MRLAIWPMLEKTSNCCRNRLLRRDPVERFMHGANRLISSSSEFGRKHNQAKSNAEGQTCPIAIRSWTIFVIYSLLNRSSGKYYFPSASSLLLSAPKYAQVARGEVWRKIPIAKKWVFDSTGVFLSWSVIAKTFRIDDLSILDDRPIEKPGAFPIVELSPKQAIEIFESGIGCWGKAGKNLVRSLGRSKVIFFMGFYGPWILNK